MTLTNREDRAYRRLNLDLIHRGLCMFLYTKLHHKLLPELHYDEAVANALEVLSSLQVNDHYRKVKITDENPLSFVL